jgi:thiol:disulfide interchange protein DsbD
LTLCAACLLIPAYPIHAAEELLDPEQAFHFSARMKDSHTIEVRYDIAKGYYMYRDYFRFAVTGAVAGDSVIPHGKRKFDINFQKALETHRGTLLIKIPLNATTGAVTLAATSQGCADVGVCYPPNTETVTLSPEGKPTP